MQIFKKSKTYWTSSWYLNSRSLKWVSTLPLNFSCMLVMMYVNAFSAPNSLVSRAPARRQRVNIPCSGDCRAQPGNLYEVSPGKWRPDVTVGNTVLMADGEERTAAREQGARGVMPYQFEPVVADMDGSDSQSDDGEVESGGWTCRKHGLVDVFRPLCILVHYDRPIV